MSTTAGHRVAIRGNFPRRASLRGLPGKKIEPGAFGKVGDRGRPMASPAAGAVRRHRAIGGKRGKHAVQAGVRAGADALGEPRQR